jgi:alkylation response protein AidB-like acyl-CoA dehydrogenase
MQTNEYVLSDAMLRAFAERAAGYDRENRFFQEDFDDLRGAGYLTMPVPKELGGRGMNLAQVAREQRRLGYYAPATALGINMHIYTSVGLHLAGEAHPTCICSPFRTPQN